MQTSQRATLDDLLAFDGKAELIGGRIVPLMSTGEIPNDVAANVFVSLLQYARRTKMGRPHTDNQGYAVTELPSGRESFSPDASFILGVNVPRRMGLIRAAPTFAVEVRSEHDYGPAKDIAVEKKREDYFAAGTLVVWDVDLEATEVRSYSIQSPDRPTVFRSGDIAHAEPALPGWRISVDAIFADPIQEIEE